VYTIISLILVLDQPTTTISR